MGSNVAPAFTNLFMMHHEINMFKVINRPIIYKRYLDDILVVCNSDEEFLTMFSHMTKMTPSLKFTYEKCTKSINFLDLKINFNKLFKSGNLSYNLYQKPDNRHLYLHPDSEVKPSIKFGWITGENIRILRNSSCKKDFKKSMSQLIEKLLQRGYTDEIIGSYVKYKYKHRHLVYDLKTSKPPIMSKFIIAEADSLSVILNSFVRKISKSYNTDIVFVEKNFHKLMDELNHLTVKVLGSSARRTVGDATVP